MKHIIPLLALLAFGCELPEKPRFEYERVQAQPDKVHYMWAAPLDSAFVMAMAKAEIKTEEGYLYVWADSANMPRNVASLEQRKAHEIAEAAKYQVGIVKNKKGLFWNVRKD